jgi:hypothetical protein
MRSSSGEDDAMTNTTDRSSNRSTTSITTQTEWLMKPNRSAILFSVVVAALALLLGVAAFAQDAEKPPEGVNSGNYNVRQSADFGYRFTNFTGSQAVYNTFVDLRPGARLLDYKLDMRSLNHQGIFFDNLSFSNFGYGGDPNNVSRLRIYKNKIYNFNANFRRDYTYWDYNLLANPLNPFNPANPAGGFTNTPANFTTQIADSPHQMGLVRRMSDYNLTLLPQSRIRFRLGYVRNIQEGPAFTTLHEGTEALILQNVKTTLNGYQFGVDFKFIPRTNISYDQFLQYYKGDTTSSLPTPYTLLNATPVAIGLPLNQVAGQPCAQPFNIAPNAGTVYAGCAAYTAYNRIGRPRTKIPIEQLSIQSNYFKNVDFSGRISYSGADMNDNSFNEILGNGVSRTLQIGAITAGPMSARRVSTMVDLAVTIFVTEKLRLVDTFRYNNYMIPGNWNTIGTSQFSQFPLLPAAPPPASQTTLNRPNLLLPAGIFDPAHCPAPFTADACPQHTTSSPADVFSGVAIRFLGQKVKYNTFEVDYDFTRRLGARVGLRYGNRLLSDLNALTYSGTGLGEVFFPGAHTNGAALASRGHCALTGTPPALPANCTLRPDGSVVFTGLTTDSDTAMNTDSRREYSALVGVWARPTDQVRMTLDVEFLSADNTFTRIAPRNLQHYKGRVNWKPVEWASMGGAFNIYESRNNVTDVLHREHNRSWSLDAVVDPKPRIGFDFGLDYNDVFSSTNICYALTSNPSPTVICPSPNPIQGISLYQTKGYFTYGSIHFKPVKRLNAYLGTYISHVSGSTTFLSPNAPAGPLQYNYYRPYAGFDFQIYQGLSWKADWNFHGYTETSVIDLSTPARNFRGNMVTLGVRYSF